jgi:hypothetical protein
MTNEQERRLLDAVLDSWDRNNRVMLNLLRLIPIRGLDARVREGSPTVSQMFSHMHHERMVSVLENAPEYAGPVPQEEWRHEHDANRILEMLHESAKQSPRGHVMHRSTGQTRRDDSSDRRRIHSPRLRHHEEPGRRRLR